jgi:N-terminal TM domain of oligopeptide transport permease C
MNAIVAELKLREKSPGLWQLAWRKLKEDRVGMVSGVIVALFIFDDTGVIARPSGQKLE